MRWMLILWVSIAVDVAENSDATYGMTPQAPCTQNCSKNAAAMTALLDVKPYGYSKAPPTMATTMILKRRPNI